MIFKHVLSHMTKNIWEIQTPAITYIRIIEKKTSYKLRQRKKKSHSIYVWVCMFYIFTPVGTDSCQNLASFWR